MRVSELSPPCLPSRSPQPGARDVRQVWGRLRADRSGPRPMTTEFQTAMAAVYREAWLRWLRRWSEDFGYDLATTAYLLLAGAIPGLADLSLNAGLDLPPELDEFTDEEFLAFLGAVAQGEHED